MNIEELREYCIAKPFVTEEFPFDQDTLVFKVMNKMFALTSLSENKSVNLKCNPELAIELREKYNGVLPGYHMSKIHWNTVMFEGNYSTKKLKEWIDHSYEQVVLSMPKKNQKIIFGEK